jgi:transcriptional regulator with XRE-family HTH domain
MAQRPKPKLLAAKLRAIRQTYKLTQLAMAQDLGVKASRISAFETGRRVPDLTILLRYSWFAVIVVNDLIDDEYDLVRFQKELDRMRVRTTPSYRL